MTRFPLMAESVLLPLSEKNALVSKIPETPGQSFQKDFPPGGSFPDFGGFFQVFFEGDGVVEIADEDKEKDEQGKGPEGQGHPVAPILLRREMVLENVHENRDPGGKKKGPPSGLAVKDISEKNFEAIIGSQENPEGHEDVDGVDKDKKDKKDGKGREIIPNEESDGPAGLGEEKKQGFQKIFNGHVLAPQRPA
jgi:hypothetical protein